MHYLNATKQLQNVARGKMRIDKWLSCVNVVKRRTVASDMVKNGVVLVNGVVAKPSKNVAVGDVITIRYLNGDSNFKVLAIPTTKTIPKSQKELFVASL